MELQGCMHCRILPFVNETSFVSPVLSIVCLFCCFSNRIPGLLKKMMCNDLLIGVFNNFRHFSWSQDPVFPDKNRRVTYCRLRH